MPQVVGHHLRLRGDVGGGVGRRDVSPAGAVGHPTRPIVWRAIEFWIFQVGVPERPRGLKAPFHVADPGALADKDVLLGRVPPTQLELLVRFPDIVVGTQSHGFPPIALSLANNSPAVARICNKDPSTVDICKQCTTADARNSPNPCFKGLLDEINEFPLHPAKCPLQGLLNLIRRVSFGVHVAKFQHQASNQPILCVLCSLPASVPIENTRTDFTCLHFGQHKPILIRLICMVSCTVAALWVVRQLLFLSGSWGNSHNFCTFLILRLRDEQTMVNESFWFKRIFKSSPIQAFTECVGI
mmetsp:Transcript_30053/g.39547  ORF Transcript_30053/g.39547 Transcript_30053/m.39547 type:complete len:299 (+) Transcript_30053:782-1678(+)